MTTLAGDLGRRRAEWVQLKLTVRLARKIVVIANTIPKAIEHHIAKLRREGKNTACLRCFYLPRHQTPWLRSKHVVASETLKKGELCVHRQAYQREAQNLSAKSKKPQCKTQYKTSHKEKELRLHTQWEELESENGQADNGGTAQNIVTAGAPFLEQDSDHDFEWFKPQSQVAKLRIGHEEPGLHSSNKSPATKANIHPSRSSHNAKLQGFGSAMKIWHRSCCKTWGTLEPRKKAAKPMIRLLHAKPVSAGGPLIYTRTFIIYNFSNFIRTVLYEMLHGPSMFSRDWWSARSDSSQEGKSSKHFEGCVQKHGNPSGASFGDHVSCNVGIELTELEKRAVVQASSSRSWIPVRRGLNHPVGLSKSRTISPGLEQSLAQEAEESPRRSKSASGNSAAKARIWRPVLSPPRLQFRAPPRPNGVARSLPKPRLKKKVKAGSKRKRLVVLESDNNHKEKQINRGKITPAHPPPIIKQTSNHIQDF